MGLAIPQFSSLFAKAHENEYKSLVRLMKLLRNEAVLRSCSYELVLDPGQQKYWVESKKKFCQDSISRDKLIPNADKAHLFPKELSLLEVAFSSSGGTPFQGSQAFPVHIDNSGFVTTFVMTFQEKESHKLWEISTTDIMGNLELKAR